MTARALVLNPVDNVAVALSDLSTGAVVDVGEGRVQAIEVIPQGHKIALADLAQDAPVIKYGSEIGAPRGRSPRARTSTCTTWRRADARRSLIRSCRPEQAATVDRQHGTRDVRRLVGCEVDAGFCDIARLPDAPESSASSQAMAFASTCAPALTAE